jgi:hypothetical protein
MGARPFLAAVLGLFLAAPPIASATEGGAPVCLADRQSYEPGAVACISGPDGEKRLARCDLHIDPVFGAYVRWTILEDSCPLAVNSLDGLERLLGRSLSSVRVSTPSALGH